MLPCRRTVCIDQSDAAPRAWTEAGERCFEPASPVWFPYPRFGGYLPGGRAVIIVLPPSREIAIVNNVGSPGYPSVVSVGRILRRRMVVVIATTLVVVGLSLMFSLRQAAVYEASAQVLLNYQNLATGLAGIQDLPTQGQDPARIAATQTQVAMSPAVASRVVKKANVPGLTIGSFLSSASVTAGSKLGHAGFRCPLLRSARSRSGWPTCTPGSTSPRDSSSTRALSSPLEGAGSANRRVARDPRHATRHCSSKLVDREQELRTLEALQTANASLLRPATSAVQVQPKPVRNVDSRADPGADARNRHRLRPRCSRYARAIGRRDGGRLRLPLLATPAGSTQEAARDEHAGDDGRPARTSVGGLPDAPLESRVRQSRPRREDDPRHERARAGRASRRPCRTSPSRSRAQGSGSPSSTSTCGARRSASSSASGACNPGVTNVVLGQVPLEQALSRSFTRPRAPASTTSSSRDRTGTGSRRPRR